MAVEDQGRVGSPVAGALAWLGGGGGRNAAAVGLGAVLLLHVLLAVRRGSASDALALLLLSAAAALHLFLRGWPAGQAPPGGRAPERGRAALVAAVVGLGAALVLAFKLLGLFWFETALFKVYLPFLTGFYLLSVGGWGAPLVHWKVLVVAVAMAVPAQDLDRVSVALYDLSDLTAATAAFLLHYLGYEVVREGTLIRLAEGTIDVYSGCTGQPLIRVLLTVALLAELVLPLRRWERVWLPLSALVVGFFVGGVRVALLARVVGEGERFAFWHGSGGKEFFSFAGILLFGLLWRPLLRYFVDPAPPPGPAHGGGGSAETSPRPSPSPPPPLARCDRPRLHGVPLAAAGAMALVLVSAVAWPGLGRREVDLPEPGWADPPAGWSVVESAPLDDAFDPEVGQLRFERYRAARRLRCTWRGREFDLELRYVVGVLGGVEMLLPKHTRKAAWVDLLPAGLEESPAGGFFCRFRPPPGERAVLQALIGREGGAVVTTAQVLRQQADFDLRPGRLPAWILGREPLKDRRRIWVEISTPASEGAAAETALEEAWESWFPILRARFPGP